MGRIIVRGTRDKPRVYADYYDVDRTRRTRLLHGVRTKMDGRKRLASIEARVAAGKPGMEGDEPAPPKPVIGACGPLIDLWLKTLHNRNAHDDELRAKKHLKPIWDSIQMVQAQEMAPVMGWLDDMRASGELSEQSMRHNLNLLSRFFSWAIERGHARMNPVRMIPMGKRPRPAAGKEGPWIRDDETFAKAMAALIEPVNLMFYLGNRSGMRPGEVAGLRMEDFNWLDEGIIRVGHSYDAPLKEDKAGASKVKWVPAAGDAPRVLGQWLKQRTKAGAGPNDLVFPFVPAKPQNRRRTSEWKGFRKEYIEACWEAARDTLNLELTLYEATRHSFISRNLEAGVPLDEVSAAVGHSSPVLTKRFYDRYVRRTFSDAIRGIRPRR